MNDRVVTGRGWMDVHEYASAHSSQGRGLLLGAAGGRCYVYRVSGGARAGRETRLVDCVRMIELRGPGMCRGGFVPSLSPPWGLCDIDSERY